LRERFDEERLGQAGRAGDETMPAGEERDEQLLDDFVLADDDLPSSARISRGWPAGVRRCLSAAVSFTGEVGVMVACTGFLFQ